MRLATFNVENMFDHAKALNGANWDEGKPALEAHKELNTLFEKARYSADDKAHMLKLFEKHGLLKTDDGHASVTQIPCRHGPQQSPL
jgi:hypothetical protein